MGTKGQEHLHNYYRATNKVYRCTKPGCRHMISKLLMLNLIAECPRCGSAFKITREHLRRKTLNCLNCKGNLSELPEVPKLSPFEELLRSGGKVVNQGNKEEANDN